ncbi:low molecular weight protein arginine phosphatase [Oceanobacillus bengalensis]|uniref:Low molecular weight protein arginine phosphatase n=1 Tax=Oceanobacillus bengalensis TaxID=1435466 RepID=A0A494YYT1_9BACI|nr:low molecular weight protein arginine phosphatase [Oceanobacillus bengalensis]RKQ15371.1 low molecular weight protein arginine phosphatase [Oceanobacillus bengalensis]
MRILFVCTGNTCRSPMAEGLLKHKMPEIEVQSAGIYAGENQQANEKAIQVLRKRHISINHRTQAVGRDLLEWAEIVLTMTSGHKRSMMLDFPDYQEKIFTLKEYVAEGDKEIWKEVIQAYANLEEKRLKIVQEQRQKKNQVHFNQIVEDYLQDDINHIRSLESNLINYDISDPFGGDIRTYEATLEELDQYIELLIKKIK